MALWQWLALHLVYVTHSRRIQFSVFHACQHTYIPLLALLHRNGSVGRTERLILFSRTDDCILQQVIKHFYNQSARECIHHTYTIYIHTWKTATKRAGLQATTTYTCACTTSPYRWQFVVNPISPYLRAKGASVGCKMMPSLRHMRYLFCYWENPWPWHCPLNQRTLDGKVTFFIIYSFMAFWNFIAVDTTTTHAYIIIQPCIHHTCYNFGSGWFGQMKTKNIVVNETRGFVHIYCHFLFGSHILSFSTNFFFIQYTKRSNFILTGQQEKHFSSDGIFCFVRFACVRSRPMSLSLSFSSSFLQSTQHTFFAECINNA